MEIKNITLPNKLNLSLIIVNNKKFIVINNNLQTKYIFVPFFVTFQKTNNLLSLINSFNDDAKKKADYNQFFNRLKFSITHLSTIFKKKLTLKGLGYKMIVQNKLKKVQFKLGFSHLKSLKIPEDVRIKKTKKFISVESKNKVLLGNFTNKILLLKSSESYKLKGFLFKYQKKKLKIVKKK